MLAVMVAPTVGINPLDPMIGLRRWSVLLPLVPQALPVSVVGLPFAALIVLPAMGLPVTLVALLTPLNRLSTWAVRR